MNQRRRERVLAVLEAKFEKKKADAAAQQVELATQLKLVEETIRSSASRREGEDDGWGGFSATAPGSLAKALDYLLPIMEPPA